MAEESPPADVFALLDDEYARGILLATNTKPMSVPQLSTELEASRSTVYRRIEQLEELDLLSESTKVDEDGHHHGVYEAKLNRVVVKLGEDEFELTVTRSDHPADKFTAIWEDL